MKNLYVELRKAELKLLNTQASILIAVVIIAMGIAYYFGITS